MIKGRLQYIRYFLAEFNCTCVCRNRKGVKFKENAVCGVSMYGPNAGRRRNFFFTSTVCVLCAICKDTVMRNQGAQGRKIETVEKGFNPRLYNTPTKPAMTGTHSVIF